jgi:hypothetical protein
MRDALSCKLATRHNAAFVFFHPDCTVGIGFSPILSTKGTRGLSPPIEEFRLAPKTNRKSIRYTAEVKQNRGLICGNFAA